MVNIARPTRPLLWVASSKRDYREFPPRVQDTLGFELFLAQTGQHPPSAKPLRGLGSGVVELIEDFDGNTYTRYCHAEKRHRSHQTPAEGCRV